MLLRPPFVIAIVIIFSMLCGWMLMNGLQDNNAWSSVLAIMAICCIVFFVHLYHQLLITPPNEPEAEITDNR